MRIALVHNLGAGHGVYSTDDLVGLFCDAGYAVETFSGKRSDVSLAIDSNPDVLVVAGGDGTVAKVAVALCDIDLPLFILPVGTSNNIARAVGADATIPKLVTALGRARAGRLDIGRIRSADHDDSFVEAVGVGFIGSMLGEADRPHIQISRFLKGLLTRSIDRQQRAARGVARIVRRHPARHLSIHADGEDLSGQYVAVKVMNIPAIGPRVLLAPGADPGDGRLDLVLVRPEDREALADFIEARATAADAPPIVVRRVRHVELDWPPSDAHVDDALWPSGRAAPRPARVTVDLRGVTSLLIPSR